MKNSITNKLIDNLKQFEDKAVTLQQMGFVSNQLFIDKLIYNIEFDTLNLKDDSKDTYVSINLNQVYKIDYAEKEILLYLDNDTQIKIKK